VTQAPSRSQFGALWGEAACQTTEFSPSFPFQPPPPHQSISQQRCTAAQSKLFQINALNLVGKIGLPSSFGENLRIRRENAEMIHLSTLKLARKSFVFKGI
jgi:hypothetical protein